MSESPAIDERPADSRRVEIYAAVIRDVIEFRDVPVFVWTQLCPDADEAKADYGRCPEALAISEQEAISALLAEDVPNLSFVTDTFVDEETFRQGAELVRLGPIQGLREESEGDQHFVRIQVPAMHICGAVCGGGSIWVVDQSEEGWKITGPAPGYGEWIA